MLSVILSYLYESTHEFKPIIIEYDVDLIDALGESESWISSNKGYLYSEKCEVYNYRKLNDINTLNNIYTKNIYCLNDIVDKISKKYQYCNCQ